MRRNDEQNYTEPTETVSLNRQKRYELRFLREITRRYYFRDSEKYPTFEMRILHKRLSGANRKTSRFPMFLTEFPLLQQLADEGYYEVIDLQKDIVTLRISERSKITRRYDECVIRNLHRNGEPATVQYNPHSGDVIFNGVKKKLKNRNKKIFTLLYKNVNTELEKGMVWRTAGRRGRPQGLDDTWTFNSYITNLRRSLGGVSPEHIRLNKTVQLWAITKLTDENDLII